MEIVTEPDFRSADEAAAFVSELKCILEELGTCDCRMEGMFNCYADGLTWHLFSDISRTLLAT